MLLPFQWGKGGRALTPEDVARERELVALARSKMGDTSPVGHWTQGATRVVDALGGVLREKRTNKAEAAGMAGADAYIQSNPVLAALIGGGAPPPPSLPEGASSSSASSGTPPSVTTDPNEVLAADAMAALGVAPQKGYIDSLIGTESGGNWAARNSEVGAGGKAGHFGRVQFGHARLQDAMNAGAIPQGTTPEQFMASPELQMAAESWHFADLERELAPYVGSVVNGQPLDMGALVAMGHLGGAGGAKRYVETGGAYNPSDSFGTSLSDYASTHGGKGGGYSGGGMSSGGSPMPISGGGADVTAALAAAMSDPWVAKKYGPVLEALMGQEMKRGDMQFQAQLAQSDPMYQAQLEAQQLELEALRNPVAAPREPIEVGGVLLDPLTYEPIFDSRTAGGAGAPETQVFFDEATGQEYRAQWNGTEWVRIGGTKAPSGPLVENNIGGADGKFEEAFAKGDAATIETVNNAGLAAQRNLGRIDQLESILGQTSTGMGASLAQTAGEWGINTEGLSDIQAAQALINSLVPEQRQPGSGPMSDADLALFKQSLPRIINQPGGNQTIIDTMRAIAQYDAEGAAIVQRMRLPSDDPNYLDRSEAFAALQGRSNPLEKVKESAVGGAIPVGTVEDGYRYIGGDPAQPESWEVVQ
ncbi:MAG: hypothetical protein ACRCXM_09050 [Beijerinckiaceae bacterium]